MIKGQVKIKQKTINHEPQEKMLDAFIVLAISSKYSPSVQVSNYPSGRGNSPYLALQSDYITKEAGLALAFLRKYQQNL